MTLRLAAVIPSLNPDEKFCGVVTGLIEIGFDRVYIVDDGSDEEHGRHFEKAELLPEVVLIRHDRNCGKGRALKSAMKLYLEQSSENYLGIVTVDGDGQHSPEDSLAVARKLAENPEALVLGVRDFDAADVPKRSAFGNKLTRNILKAAFGIRVSDTQTGLRAIPNNFAHELLEVQGERYEFETNMLLQASKMRVPIVEAPIETVYIDNNSASHYRALRDSMRILALILKFALVSICSAALDYLLFGLFNYVFAALTAELRLLIAVASARVFSSLFNFTLNKAIVFHSRAERGRALLRYAALAAAIMLGSYGGIFLLSEVLPLHPMLAKPISDLALFFISFRIQRRWVF